MDLVQVSRIGKAVERHGERFLRRILSPGEMEKCREYVADPGWLAQRFAAKEACLKALGTGWADGISFPQVRVEITGSGGWRMEFTGTSETRAQELGIRRSAVSISVREGLAAAVVILEG